MLHLLTVTAHNFAHGKGTISHDRKCQKTKRQKAYGTGCSQAVPHPSTIPARRCLTSVIRRERVCSSWYGRRHRKSSFSAIYNNNALPLRTRITGPPPSACH